MSVCYALTVFLCFFIEVSSAKGNVKFKIEVYNTTNCSNPQPPFSDRRLVILDTHIIKIKDKTYFTGKNTVLEDVSFLNYSAISYSVSSSGVRKEMAKVIQKNCRSVSATMFFILGKFLYDKRNCRLLKGISTYKNFDINKFFRSFPYWLFDGNMVMQVNLVENKRTVFCLEVFVSVKEIK